MDRWRYSEAFVRSSPYRIEQLERWHSFEAILEQIPSTKARITLRSPPLEKRCVDPTVTRVTFALCGLPQAVDAFFNGSRGYRARHLLGDPARAAAIDGMVIDAIVERHRARLSKAPGALESLRGAQAKVWIKQDPRVTDALYGLCDPGVEIEAAAWVASMNLKIDTPRGPRYLARAGVLATSGGGVLEVKGGWIKDGSPWQDTYKTPRSQQIRDYGFT